MPLPTPNSGETQDGFIGRCMGNPTAMDDFPDQEQRLAVCFSQWREARQQAGYDVDERKAVQVEIKDEEKGIVRAVFAQMNAKDKDGDWTTSGAFGSQTVRVSAYGHSSWTGELPVGKGTISESDDEAVAELRFFMSTERGREHFRTIKEMGDLQEWSYGFDVLETGELTDELEQKGVRRVISKVKVHEVSPVLLGAGLGTRTLAVKCDDCEAKADSAEKNDAEQAKQQEAERQAESQKKAERYEKAQKEWQRLQQNIKKYGRRW